MKIYSYFVAGLIGILLFAQLSHKHLILCYFIAPLYFGVLATVFYKSIKNKKQ